MTLGFIGLGVMGEPMCRNLARKSGAAVVAFDQRAEPLAALARDGVAAAGSAGEVLARADLIFMCLPGEPQVRAVALGPDGLAARVRAGQTVVDMSTAPVALARTPREPSGPRARGSIASGPRSPARPRRLPSRGKAIGLDVGGTKLAAAVVDAERRRAARLRRPMTRAPAT